MKLIPDAWRVTSGFGWRTSAFMRMLPIRRCGLPNRKQSLKLHVCDRCGRKVYGNSFHRHLRACAKKAAAATNKADNHRMY